MVILKERPLAAVAAAEVSIRRGKYQLAEYDRPSRVNCLALLRRCVPDPRGPAFVRASVEAQA
jgi:hypothetical protein